MKAVPYIALSVFAAAVVLGLVVLALRLARRARARARATHDERQRAAAVWWPYFRPDERGDWHLGAERVALTSAGRQVLDTVPMHRAPADLPEHERLVLVQDVRDRVRQYNDALDAQAGR